MQFADVMSKALGTEDGLGALGPLPAPVGSGADGSLSVSGDVDD